jgi:hypothetical protein
VPFDPISIGQALAATQRLGSALHTALDGRAFSNAVGSITGTPICDLEHSATGFEIRLDHDDTVDLGVLLTPEAGRDDFAHSLESRIAPLLRSSREWERLARLCCDWADPASHARARIRQMFLEFDAPDGRSHETPVPSVFLSVRSRFGWEVVDDTNTTDWLLDEALPTLNGAALPPSLRGLVQRCIAALPAEGRLLHVAVMLGRTPMTLRLFLAVPVPKLKDTLAPCGWPGDTARIEALHARYGGGADFAQVQLDLFEGVSDRIGLEFSPPPNDWPRLLTRLVEDDLCLPEKRDALLAWPEVLRAPLSPGGWPCTFERELSHVKLVHRSDRPLEAKAYVTVTAGHEISLDSLGSLGSFR